MKVFKILKLISDLWGINEKKGYEESDFCPLWKSIFEDYDEETIKAAIIMIFKEFDDFSLKDEKKVEMIKNYCETIKLFHEREIQEGII